MSTYPYDPLVAGTVVTKDKFDDRFDQPRASLTAALDATDDAQNNFTDKRGTQLETAHIGLSWGPGTVGPVWSWAEGEAFTIVSISGHVRDIAAGTVQVLLEHSVAPYAVWNAILVAAWNLPNATLQVKSGADLAITAVGATDRIRLRLVTAGAPEVMNDLTLVIESSMLPSQ